VSIAVNDGRGGRDTLSFIIMVTPAQAWWTLFTTDSIGSIYSMAVTPLWVFAGISNGKVLRKPSDNSSAWEMLGGSSPIGVPVRALAIEPQTKSVYLASPAGAPGAWYCGVTGTSWTDVKGTITTPVRDLVALNDVVFATHGMSSSAVMRSKALSAFSTHGSGISYPAVALAADGGLGDLYVSTTNNMIYCDTGHVNNWVQYTTTAFQDTVVTLAATAGGGPVYAGVKGKGLYRAPNGRQYPLNFQPVTQLPASSTCLDILATDNTLKIILTAMDNSTVWVSYDNGLTWNTTGGLPSGATPRALARAGNVYYVGMSSGFIYRHIQQ